MNKRLYILSTLLCVLWVIAMSFVAPKTFRIELSEPQASTLLYMLENGKLDNVNGKDAAAMALLIQDVRGQLAKQVDTTGKKP